MQQAPANLDIQQWLQSHYTDGCNVTIKELIQYRTKTALLDLKPRRTIQAKLAGSYVTKTKGRGMKFDEARHYQPGDDIRAIDWRVTARTGKTHTKLYREERERPVFIFADFSASMYFGTQLLFKSVQAAHLAALIAWSAAARGDRVGGLIFDQNSHHEFKPFTRQKAVLSLLNGIEAMHQHNLASELSSAAKASPTQPATEPNSDFFADACARLRRLAHPGSMVFFISDFIHLSEQSIRHMSRIAQHCELTAYQITDPFEHQLPSVSVPHNVSVTDGFNAQTITLGESKTAQDYADKHQAQAHYIENALKQCQVQHIPLTAALPLQQQLSARVSNR